MRVSDGFALTVIGGNLNLKIQLKIYLLNSPLVLMELLRWYLKTSSSSTLNVLVEQSSIVSAFVLMGNKAAATYIRVFENIRGHLNGMAPQSVMIDFEMGM